MQKQSAARETRERRAETRSYVNRYFNVELSIDEFEVTYRLRIWDKTDASLSFLVKNQLEILPRLKVDAPLQMVYYPTKSPYPRVHVRTRIRHITKYDHGLLKGHYLVGLQIQNWQVPEKRAKVVFAFGERSGGDRIIPERQSPVDLKNGIDLRNRLHFRMNPKLSSDMMRRASFL